MRSPACGFDAADAAGDLRQALSGKAVIVDGMREIARHRHPSGPSGPHGGLTAPRGADGKGQARVRKRRLLLVECIRDWMIANPQQTDTVQQFLAYEKCYRITGGRELRPPTSLSPTRTGIPSPRPGGWGRMQIRGSPRSPLRPENGPANRSRIAVAPVRAGRLVNTGVRFGGRLEQQNTFLSP